MAEVWCRLECPLHLFPLPLPWCARKTTETRTPVPLSRGLDPRRGPQAPGLGRFKGMRFLREGGNRNPPSLKRLFGDFLAGQKVTRGPGPGRPRRSRLCRRFASGPAGPDKKLAAPSDEGGAAIAAEGEIPPGRQVCARRTNGAPCHPQKIKIPLHAPVQQTRCPTPIV